MSVLLLLEDSEVDAICIEMGATSQNCDGASWFLVLEYYDNRLKSHLNKYGLLMTTDTFEHSLDKLENMMISHAFGISNDNANNTTVNT